MSVTLEHVTRSVDGIPTIRDVSLTLDRGTLSVLLGPTLSGKTSIMRLLAGLDKPTTGRALVKGADLVLLDEPLANLDYKLREELRTELPRIFEASGAIFVYATTEPSEALLLGGRTVCMWEGEILQAGETSKVYRHLDTLRVAQLFSDPPLNIVGIEKRDGAVQYAGGVQAPASGLYAGLGDGAYRVGFRAHQLEVANGIAGRHAFHATVTVTEITGSESFVHLNRDASNWVAVLQGVHEYPPGHLLDAVLDPNNVFVFDAAGRLVAAPGAM